MRLGLSCMGEPIGNQVKGRWQELVVTPKQAGGGTAAYM